MLIVVLEEVNVLLSSLLDQTSLVSMSPNTVRLLMLLCSKANVCNLGGNSRSWNLLYLIVFCSLLHFGLRYGLCLKKDLQL